MAGEGIKALCPFPIPGPMHLAVPESHPFVINQGSNKRKRREYKWIERKAKAKAK